MVKTQPDTAERDAAHAFRLKSSRSRVMPSLFTRLLNHHQKHDGFAQIRRIPEKVLGRRVRTGGFDRYQHCQQQGGEGEGCDFVHLISTRFAARKVTGPSKPESSRGVLQL